MSKPINNNGSTTSLRLTVKAPPSKLRQAISGSAFPPNPYADQSESDGTPAPPVRTARTTRNPKIVVDPDSDQDEEEEDEDAEGDELDEEEERGESNDDSEDDAEGEEDEDALLHHPPPPVIKQQKTTSGHAKPQVTVMPPHTSVPLKSVEAKEMDDQDDEDDDLSELDSNDELGNDMDENDDDGSELASDSDDPDSTRATPDLTKLTKRQRGALEEEDPSLLALSNEALKKKHLTAEEHVQRRAEMARRRKNLSEKRNEEEKVQSPRFSLHFNSCEQWTNTQQMETINKLLQKQAPKRRTRAEINAANAAAEAEEREDEEGNPRVNPVFTKWVQNRDGSRLGVPREWMEGTVGEIFRGNGGGGGGGRMMVEEVI